MVDMFFEYLNKLFGSGLEFATYAFPLVLLFFLFRGLRDMWNEGTLLNNLSICVFSLGGLALAVYHFFNEGSLWVGLLITLGGVFVGIQVNDRFLQKNKKNDDDD